jgi:hypothetical protein
MSALIGGTDTDTTCKLRFAQGFSRWRFGLVLAFGWWQIHVGRAVEHFAVRIET